ncbi:hypothetical protein B5M09_012596 [Aphanomyces astaci]|uniref:Uncharacterized protein n=1 Tax=Aphanomyces astaci TaxID=112090 RepID=A0A3R7YK64_APHAT|nr:hypothetical protein B5M09_012596 [Aphanomyces astaci]
MSPTYDKTTILLDDKNWSTWRTFIKGRLMGKGLIHTLLRHSSSMKTVERTMNRDEFASRAIPEVDAITYAKDNQKALGIIIESINVNQYQHVDGLTDALAAYLAFKAHHEPQTHVDKIGLLAEYHAIRWEPKRETLPVFIDRFYNLVRKLRDAAVATEAAVDAVVVHQKLAEAPAVPKGVKALATTAAKLDTGRPSATPDNEAIHQRQRHQEPQATSLLAPHRITRCICLLGWRPRVSV